MYLVSLELLMWDCIADGRAGVRVLRSRLFDKE